MTGRQVPSRVRAWVAEALQLDGLRYSTYPAGLTGTVFRVGSPAGEAWVLRSLPPASWGTEAARHIASERLACTILADSTVPVPRLVAVDPDGSRAGAPSSLTTELPGRIRLEPPSGAELESLAGIAVAVHATPVTGERPRTFVLWSQGRVRVPDWAADRDLWARAIAVFEAGPPPTPQVLIHRDFHPGNVLWLPDLAGTGHRISGVIDWAEAAWGPPDLDVAHSVTNLALLGGTDRAAAFSSAYRAAGGRLAPGRDGAFWALADLFGFLPDPTVHLAGLMRVRTDLDRATVLARAEELVGAIMTGPLS